MYEIYHKTSKIGLTPWNPWSSFDPKEPRLTRSGSANPPHNSLLAVESATYDVPEIREEPKDPPKLQLKYRVTQKFLSSKG